MEESCLSESKSLAEQVCENAAEADSRFGPSLAYSREAASRVSKPPALRCVLCLGTCRLGDWDSWFTLFLGHNDIYSWCQALCYVGSTWWLLGY